MTKADTKITIFTPNSHHEFSHSELFEIPDEHTTQITVKSDPFDGWETANSAEITSEGSISDMLILAVGKHLRTPDGLSFRIERSGVVAYDDFKG